MLIAGFSSCLLETKLIFDKVVGKSVFAFNATHEYEKEFEWVNGKMKSDNWDAKAQRTTLDYLAVALPLGKLGVGF